MGNMYAMVIIAISLLLLLFGWQNESTVTNLLGTLLLIVGILKWISDSIKEKNEKKEKEAQIEKEKEQDLKIELLAKRITNIEGSLRTDELTKPLYNKIEQLESKNEYLIAIDQLKDMVLQGKITLENQIAVNFKIARGFQIIGNQFSNSKRYYEIALGLVKSISDVNNREIMFARIYHNLGVLYKDQNPKEAMNLFDQAEDLYKKHRIKKEIADIYSLKGDVLQTTGETGLAFELHSKALEIYIEIKDSWGQSNVQLNLAILYRDRGQYNLTIEHCEKSLVQSLKNNFVKLEANAYHHMGVAFKNLSQFDKAKTNLNKAIEIYQKRNDLTYMAYCYGNLGLVAMQENDVESSENYHLKAIQLFEYKSNQRGIANENANLGNVYSLQSKWEEAKNQYDKALIIHKKIDYKLGIATDLASLGSFYLNTGDKDNFKKYVLESIKIFEEIDNQPKAHELRELLKTHG